MNPLPALPRSSLCLLIIVALGLAGLVPKGLGAESRPDLHGTVLDEAGKPVANATVFIYTAGPKQGTGVLCPSCYADCRKRTVSSGDGSFTIPSLDPDLLFQLLVVGEKFQPKFVSKVDPATEPLAVKLKPRIAGDSPGQRVTGRVVDAEGSPIEGAVVSIRGISRGNSTRFGGNDDVDPVAVSDAAGEFAIHGREAFDAAGVEVEARGFAKVIFQRLSTGDTRHELKLTEGASLNGRVLKDGKPLAGVEIGVAGANRSSDIFVGNYVVATDAEGRFSFVNLPARTAYVLCGLMKSLEDRDTIPQRQVRTDGDGTTLEVGDVAVKPGFVVAGEVRLTDGAALPPNTRVLLSRDDAWDTQEVIADANGRFRFAGVPAEGVTLSLRVKGYRFSLRNASLDPLNPYRLLGRVQADKTNLVVLLEPGEQQQRLSGDYELVGSEPLRGTEPAQPMPGDLEITGTAVDAKTREPLRQFTVTPGRQSQTGQGFDWFLSRTADFSNGTFSVRFSGQPHTPGVMVEAEGYLPQDSGPIAVGQSNLVVALKRGSGYGGLVRNPDGSPATNVTVYLTDLKNGVYVTGSNLAVRDELFSGTKKTRTDAAGRFQFKPQMDAYAIMIVAPEGYVELPVAGLKEDAEIRLQPYARIQGKLVIGSRPGTNESIRLGLAHIPYYSNPRSFPALSLFLDTRTDDTGKFVFERVPPIAVEVYHEPKVRDSRMGTIAQSQTEKFTLNPGEAKQLTLGGQGRPVVGRLVVKGYEGKIDYRADVFSLETVLPNPEALPDLAALSKKVSAKLATLSTDEERRAELQEFQERQKAQVEATQAFYQSDAGREYFFRKRRFALNFKPDGTFRVEDVPGGKYSLRIDLREGTGDDFTRLSSPAIASLVREVEVPDSPGGRTDQPFDLGDIEVQARRVMKTGQTAPEFAVKTLEGQPLKLADFKGKYVLLDFWATWCGPCVAETPHLKAAWEAFKDRPDFALVGLSLDPGVEAPKAYAKKNDLTWTQGFLGEWSNSDVPARFGVEGIPAIFLIGPDGKIIATGLRGESIRSAVEKALPRR